MGECGGEVVAPVAVIFLFCRCFGAVCHEGLRVVVFRDAFFSQRTQASQGERIILAGVGVGGNDGQFGRGNSCPQGAVVVFRRGQDGFGRGNGCGGGGGFGCGLCCRYGRHRLWLGGSDGFRNGDGFVWRAVARAQQGVEGMFEAVAAAPHGKAL